MIAFARTPAWIGRTGAFAKLSPAAKAVLYMLTHFIGPKGYSGSVSTARLAELTGLSERSTRRGLSELVSRNIIERDARGTAFTIIATETPNKGRTPVADIGHQWPQDGEVNGHVCPDERTQVADAADTGGRKTAPSYYKQEALTRTLSQELEPGARDGLIPYNGKRVDPTEVHKAMLDRIGWPDNRRANAKNLVAHALLALADGAEGTEAESDPVPWLAVQLKAAVDGAEEPRFIPKIGNWFNENYPHLVFNAQPTGYGRRMYG